MTHDEICAAIILMLAEVDDAPAAMAILSTALDVWSAAKNKDAVAIAIRMAEAIAVMHGIVNAQE